MKKVLFLSVLLFALCGMTTNGDCFINLGQTYTVPQGSTFSADQQEYLVGNLNVAGTYNNNSGLLVNNLNVSGTFNNNNDGGVTPSSGWYYEGLNVTVTPTGNYNQSGGGFTEGGSFLNQGTVQITGDQWWSGWVGNVFQNDGTLNVFGGRMDGATLINNGTINTTQKMDFLEYLNLNISNGIITNIVAKPGLIFNYDATRTANAYLGNKDYQLSGGGLLTRFNDVVAVTTNQSYTFTAQGAAWISFNYWWQMGVSPPPYQQGYDFDVLALQGGSGWQYIGQIDAYSSSTGWDTATFTLPESLQGAGTEIRFVLNDYPPETDPVLYLRAITTLEPTTMLLLGFGLFGLVGFRRKFRK